MNPLQYLKAVIGAVGPARCAADDQRQPDTSCTRWSRRMGQRRHQHVRNAGGARCPTSRWSRRVRSPWQRVTAERGSAPDQEVKMLRPEHGAKDLKMKQAAQTVEGFNKTLFEAERVKHSRTRIGAARNKMQRVEALVVAQAGQGEILPR